MKILGIETSCDDTGVAALEISGYTDPRFSILSNAVASQIDAHQEYGGVYPTLAKREHIKNLPITLEKSLQEADVEKTDAIAVTYGPGLSPCLWTGLNFAKDLAVKWNVPLIPTNHIEGHMLVALLDDEKSQIPGSKSQINPKFKIQKNIFPGIALIVSGGHTQLVLVKDIGEYKIIGETRDDAAGECFDKTARILGLPYPGGPEIAAQAATYKIQDTKYKIQLPRPMLHTKDFDFSFSGLKTAVLYDHKARPEKERESKEYVQEMAAEIQQAIIDVLVHKTLKAAKECAAKSIILGGGVSANDELRRVFEAKLQTLNLKETTGVVNIKLLAPAKNLSTDNGAMIALAGYFNFKAGKNNSGANLVVNSNLRLA
jgi:N6-L-threonylcarbamoyladenine synthase